MIRFDVYSVTDKDTNEISYTNEEKQILENIQEIYKNQEMSNISDKLKVSVMENEFDKESYVIYGSVGVAVISVVGWLLSYYLSSANKNSSSNLGKK